MFLHLGLLILKFMENIFNPNKINKRKPENIRFRSLFDEMSTSTKKRMEPFNRGLSKAEIEKGEHSKTIDKIINNGFVMVKYSQDALEKIKKELGAEHAVTQGLKKRVENAIKVLTIAKDYKKNGRQLGRPGSFGAVYGIPGNEKCIKIIYHLDNYNNDKRVNNLEEEVRYQKMLQGYGRFNVKIPSIGRLRWSGFLDSFWASTRIDFLNHK